MGYEEGLNAIEWDEDARQGLQDTLENGGHLAYCAPDVSGFVCVVIIPIIYTCIVSTLLHVIHCSYSHRMMVCAE